jgi:hypothetical protein
MYLLKDHFKPGEEPDIHVNISYAEKEKYIVIHATYSGRQVNPFAETANNDNLGLLLIERMSKSVLYSAEDNKNILTITL